MFASSDIGWIRAIFLVAGLVFGSFGNVLIARIPKGKSIGGRSACPRCKEVLAPWEIVPLISFLILRGRCAHCGKRISAQYPIIEGATAFLFVLATFIVGEPVSAGILALVLWLLLLIAVVDEKTQMIPDVFSIPLVVLCIAEAIFMDTIEPVGPLLLGLFFAIQWLISRGKWVGSGDILLGIALGFLLGGWIRAVFCLALAYIIGGVVASFLLLSSRADRKSHVAFAPFLAASALLTLLYGDALLGSFLGSGI
ncbi:MAG: prepilin peptidase [Candidatus Peribacteraceae bacterium]|nr:prepilin peptidase [Candidatus Peribacteraceae bacterium]MDD5074727.1 prepilin peptidase [Candidatus Peribacteraceae bacterium]